MDELKACPFCGGKVTYDEWYVGDCSKPLYRTLCKGDCPGGDYNGDTPEEVANYWNTRPLEDALRAELDQANGERKEVIYLNGIIRDQLKNMDAELEQVKAENARLKSYAEKLRENVAIFAAQLIAWGHDAAAKEMLEEIIGDEVVAPDYYKMVAENARLREALETCVWLTGGWAENYLVGPESHKGRYKLLEGNSRRALAGKEPDAK